MSLRLARIETFLYRAEVKEPVKTSFGSIPRRSVLLLRAEDTDGAHGWGEVWCNFPTLQRGQQDPPVRDGDRSRGFGWHPIPILRMPGTA